MCRERCEAGRCLKERRREVNGQETGNRNGRAGGQGGWQTFREKNWQKSQNIPLGTSE